MSFNIFCSKVKMQFVLLIAARCCHILISTGNGMGWEMSNSLQAMVLRPNVADWGSGMSASCKPWIQLFAVAVSRWLHSALQYY